MQVQLLVKGDCAPCAKAEALWRAVSEEVGFALSVLDIDKADGAPVSHSWRLTTVPAVMIDGALVAIGVQSREQSFQLLRSALAGAS